MLIKMSNVFLMAVKVARNLNVAIEVDCETNAFSSSSHAAIQLSPRGLYLTKIYFKV